MTKALDIYRKKHENILLMGDYNIDVKETNIRVFYSRHKLKALNEERASKILTIHHALTSSLQIAQKVSKNA